MVTRAAVAAGACLALAAGASAQVNSWGTFLGYFDDITTSTPSVTHNTLDNLTIHEGFPQAPAGAGGVNRDTGALSADNGGTPYHVNNALPWYYQVTVQLDGLASNEAGMHIGQLGGPNGFGPQGAITGQVMVNAGGEIAAFGAWLPFFSNNQPQFSYLPRGQRGSAFTLGIFVDPNPAAPFTEYFVNGVPTGPIAMDAGTLNFYMNTPNTLGVYGQGSWRTTGPTDATYTFTNPFIGVPSPSSAMALGLGGLLAARRRRRA
jgi:hypothetical protein